MITFTHKIEEKNGEMLVTVVWGTDEEKANATANEMAHAARLKAIFVQAVMALAPIDEVSAMTSDEAETRMGICRDIREAGGE